MNFDLSFPLSHALTASVAHSADGEDITIITADSGSVTADSDTVTADGGQG